MQEKDHTMEIPEKQKMERQETIAREHTQEYNAALHRAVSLSVPHAFAPSPYGTFAEERGNRSHEGESSSLLSSKKQARESWNDLIERLFENDESGHIVFKKSHSTWG